MARRKLIAANWKMYKTPEQAHAFVRTFLPLVQNHTRDEIVICPPFVDLYEAVDLVRGSTIGVGAQDVYWKNEGAFTGEISPQMLVAAGCTHVIIGHSERRQFFGETDDTVNAKLKASLAAGLVAIVCVGELLEERESGLTEDVLRRQCTRAFFEITAEQTPAIAIAYEPVWAIGTGKTATPQLAAEAHLIIRDEAASAFGTDAAGNLRILYGGSVKPENASALMAEPEIDGALVGGASLDPESFAKIVKY
jgi:triosephosphate isomerase